MFDSTTEFMKGAILAYCQTHEPEEVAMLFDDVFLILDIKKAANISDAIAGRCTNVILNIRNEKPNKEGEIDE